MIKHFYIITFITITYSLNAQFWSHSFESSGGYTASIAEFSDGDEDYWGRIDLTNKVMTDGTAIGSGASSVSGFGGDWVFGGSDINGEGATLPVNIVFDDIDILGKAKLLFQVKLGEDDDGSNENWDASDYVKFYYDIDNSGTWTNLMFIENDGTTYNTAPGIDSDFDGDNDGILITNTFVLFEKYISSTGSIIDIKVEWNLNAGDEDLYIDNLALYDGTTISGTSGFRMMSSPVSGAIFSDLLEELWTQGMTGGDVTSGDANVWTFDVSGQSWTALSNLSTASLTAGEGFLVYVFANTDNSGGDDLPVTLSVTGTGNSSGTTVGSISSGDWALVGNPYAQTVDWDLITQANVTASAYVWDNAKSGGADYRTWNGSAGDLSNGLIAPYQGFWVQASGGTGSVTIETVDKSSSAGIFYKTMNDSTGSMSFTITSSNYSDQTFVSFTNNGEEGMDNADAYKLLPMTPTERVVGTGYVEGNGLAINNLPYVYDGTISIPLDIMYLSLDENYHFVTEENEITITWDLNSLPDHITMVLTDNITGTITNLDEENEHAFTTEEKGSFPAYGSGGVNIYPEVGGSRFTLTVNYSALGTKEEPTNLPKTFALHPAYPNPFNPIATIKFDIEVSHVSLLQVFDLQGKLVKTLINEVLPAGSHGIQWNPTNLPSGFYILQLKVGNKTFTQKITFIK